MRIYKCCDAPEGKKEVTVSFEELKEAGEGIYKFAESTSDRKTRIIVVSQPGRTRTLLFVSLTYNGSSLGLQTCADYNGCSFVKTDEILCLEIK